MVLLWFGKRGIMVYDTEEPLKLPMWSYLLNKDATVYLDRKYQRYKYFIKFYKRN